MSDASPNLRAGAKVIHPDLGEGVVLNVEPTGFARVFFLSVGERQVHPTTLRDATSWTDRVISGLRPATPDALEKLWLAIEAAELPLIDSAATLTAAKVALLPHQVVLVHRLTRVQPRRFLIADEVGLGKTIETALILRELASRGELTRALMVVPASLVENWRHELNDVFNLDFEVFGYEGDVTDRKTNAFARHNRIIASVDTLKRSARIKRLLEAPMWDLVVFDEAHHLSVYKTGNKVRKTENFKLAEVLRDHCRDLLLLSATPHQGDHFRFWMLIRLLEPTLFEDEIDMLDNRYRLNAVVIRRTKADACAPDGSPLFARRVVNTEAFTLSGPERQFYDALQEYLQDGYNLAEKQGGKGRALGFVMTIFQKIAASSFAAVKATLERRQLMLTVRDAIERDEMLDVDGRDRVLREARQLVCKIYGLGDDPVSQAQADQLLAEAKIKILRRREAEELAFEGYDDTEIAAAYAEDSAATFVGVALPEERRRISELLMQYPSGTETKVTTLLSALHQLWQINSREKIVIFTTYLGSVDNLRDAIGSTFPGKGVEVLKGGDHGAKTAAQRRFKREDGPQVLICTAAGREGINLQFAHVLFNHDLPWNPMDLEQRIGRIHRYGQQQTAQVYNLVASDTIEGEIFLLLEDKLNEIAQALGKVDESGQIAEDLRAQILGQLGSQLSYDKLYQEAVRDPSLKRTRQELEVAIANANLARQVVFELFQDLERFDLSQYRQMEDPRDGMARLVSFVKRAVHQEGGELRPKTATIYELVRPGQPTMLFSTDRDQAISSEEIALFGLEHPVVQTLLGRHSDLEPEQRAVLGYLEDFNGVTGLFTLWRVLVDSPGSHVRQQIIRLGINPSGERSPRIERMEREILRLIPRSQSQLGKERITSLVNSFAPEMLHRELMRLGALQDGSSYSSQMIACAELT